MASEEQYKKLKEEIESEWSRDPGFEAYDATEAARKAESLWPDNLQREAAPLDRQLARFIETHLDDEEVRKYLPPPPRGPNATRKYILSNGDEITASYFRPRNKWCVTYESHKFVADDPDSVAMLVERSLDTVHDLSEDQLLTVARYAQNSMTTEAINAYLSFSLGYKVDEVDEIACNPKFRGLCDQAVQFVFLNANQDFAPEENWPVFVEQFAAGRPLTIALMTGARKAFEEKHNSLRYRLLNRAEEDRKAQEQMSPAEVARGLNELSDDDVNSLYTDTKRLAVRNRR